MSPKPLSCLFKFKVLCSFRKSEKFGIMGRCLKCSHYLSFVRDMEKEEDEFFEEVERVRRAECCCVCGCNLSSGNRSDVWNVCGRCKHTLEM